MDLIILLGQKNTLVEYMILFGADNRPPMLDKELYDFWKSRMELYMQNKEHERMILESVEHGLLIWPTVEENGVIRTKKYAELSAAKKIQVDCSMKATNIILQGLHADIYSLVNHHRGESLHTYYLRFTQLINDMNTYNMKMEQFQVNTKFFNSLQPEWSKFVTDVKVVKDLHTSNYDQLHAYLEQHELHANEVVQIVLWYLDSECSKHMIGNRSQLMNFVSKFLGIVGFGNDQIARIMGSRPGLHVMTSATPSTRLVSNPGSQQPFQVAATPRAKVLADSHVSISISQDAPSTSIPSSQAQEHSLIISQGFKESPKTLKFHDDPLNKSPQDSPSQGSSSNVIQIHTSFEHLGRWTKDHPKEM
nr:integrase, catalytic region, zinc finger, CCHC-type, peptidase aspartic, catalytic [Tanacetum cinerariifolium]